MRRAILKALVFVAVLIALDRLVYASAVFLRDNAGHPQEIDLIYDEGWDPPIVFFGDSRTKRNFDMRPIEAATGMSAYNFGIDGASADETLFMLQEYLRHGHRPLVVAFEADPRELDQKVGVFQKAHFRDHLAVVPDPEDLLRVPRPTLEQRVSSFAVNWLVRTASLPNRLPQLWQHWRERHDDGDEPSQIYVCGENSSIRCVDYHGSALILPGSTEKIEQVSMPFSIDESRMKIYRRVAALAEEYGFWLVLDETPRFHGDQAYPPDVKARGEDFYCSLAKANPRVVYARLSHHDGIDQDVSLYFNWTHFNTLGAKKESEILGPLIAELARGQRREACVLD
jgi:hypothetical protein